MRQRASWLLLAHGRIAGTLVAAILVALLAVSDLRPERTLRNGLFDYYQRFMPRERVNDGVVVVAIDERSLAELGQWPWPRTQLAHLILQIATQRPAALGIDVLFAEPDRLSPQRLASGLGLDAATLQRLPDSDALLAAALRELPVVLGVGALAEDSGVPQGAPYRSAILQSGGDAAGHVPAYVATLRSLEAIDAAAAGHGVLNRAADEGLVRRVPTLVTLGKELTPGLALETLRVASGDPMIRAQLDAHGLRTVSVGELSIPTMPDGSWPLHYSDWKLRPHISAVDVLNGSIPSDLFSGRIVMLGYTALGLLDTADTALGRMPGIEVHAEALDNAIDGRLLLRPWWMERLEWLLLALLAAFGIALVPRLGPAQSVNLYTALGIAALAGSAAAFQWAGWLLDIANPLLGTAVVFATLSGIALAETQLQRRRLREDLAASRESQARLEGELDAARRIQMGMLPQPSEALGQERRVEIAARMQPARMVGGDLYDFFLLDATRLLFLIGDVSGKGLPASLFMALTKALTKGLALGGQDNPGELLGDTGGAIAADNPEQLFVTLVAGMLDLASGELRWCSAGHDPPYLLRAGEAPRRLEGQGGPPLCVIDGFRYPVETLQLRKGDLLCMVTDGVTEAHDAKGELYGSGRLLAALGKTGSQPLEEVAQSLEQDVAAFVGGAEAADDAALLLLRWHG
ncbi:CHASE2 domain-containing protein [Solimonas sp. K1W22B-7]|uniref:CHASE2 domain-containing protein n=1 Tax=Solimonas sp. K1W22B-7 TaxID=2303331 RepID=UPI000E333C17|nr:CHASE2 domain-containing protein [Solimonas sp. K1W22B-7]AXQ30972.1 CHASE2 domain-containing protein [Solimonas sp. K1W22B-7]